ncbi:MAG TPA: uroporphyrinogen decarboxylase family protein, partial [Burkholderiaceae bacterium]|nr:uroporphyrinogen decarboxylase family protein [Burkholderiaceae bacterium]
DSWGGVLADGAYQRFSLEPMRRVVAALKRERGEPVIVFTKGGGPWLEDIAGIGCDAIGVDWTVNLGRARARIGDRCALQGNLDPMVLMAEPEQVRVEAVKVLDDFGDPGPGAGHVFNLGHGISQFTPPDSVAALVEAVHAHSRRVRRRDASASSL